MGHLVKKCGEPSYFQDKELSPGGWTVLQVQCCGRRAAPAEQNTSYGRNPAQLGKLCGSQKLFLREIRLFQREGAAALCF